MTNHNGIHNLQILFSQYSMRTRQRSLLGFRPFNNLPGASLSSSTGPHLHLEALILPGQTTFAARQSIVVRLAIDGRCLVAGCSGSINNMDIYMISRMKGLASYL